MLVILDLERSKQKQLQELARRERRTVSDQVALIVEHELHRRTAGDIGAREVVDVRAQ